MRETSFQQVLLSSSGPKENIFISNFDIALGVSENVITNNIINNNFQFCKILYKTDVIVLLCDQMLNHLLCLKMADVIAYY